MDYKEEMPSTLCAWDDNKGNNLRVNYKYNNLTTLITAVDEGRNHMLIKNYTKTVDVSDIKPFLIHWLNNNTIKTTPGDRYEDEGFDRWIQIDKHLYMIKIIKKKEDKKKEEVKDKDNKSLSSSSPASLLDSSVDRLLIKRFTLITKV